MDGQRTRIDSTTRSQLRAISWLVLLAMVPVVFYFTSHGTWNPRIQNLNAGWSARYFMSQAEAMLSHARLDVEPCEIQGECFNRDSLCYGYFGLTPSLLRIPVLGILRYFHSALTPLFLAFAVLLAYWAALQILQRAVREAADRDQPKALSIGYFTLGALALVPGGTLLFVTRPAVFEEAIAWSVAFALLTLNHVWSWHSGERRSLVPAVLFAIAGANARPTVAPAAAVLGVVVAVLWFFQDRDPSAMVSRSQSRARVLIAAACLSLLPGLTAGGVFWLKLRTPIPSALLNEQFQSAPHWKKILDRNGGRTTGLMFAPTELASYFRPDGVTRSATWPFFDFRDPTEAVVWVPPLPEGGAYVERFTSLTATMPLAWIVNLVVAIWLGVAGWRLAGDGKDKGSVLRVATLTREQWILAAGLLVSAAAMFVLPVTTVGITNRYLSDFFPTSVVGIALGYRVIVPFLSRRPVVAASAGLVGLLLVVWSIVVTLSLTTHLVFD